MKGYRCLDIETKGITVIFNEHSFPFLSSNSFNESFPSRKFKGVLTCCQVNRLNSQPISQSVQNTQDNHSLTTPSKILLILFKLLNLQTHKTLNL